MEFEKKKLGYNVTQTGSSVIQSNPDDPITELGSQLGWLLVGTIDATWEVKMPGKVEKHNADRCENNVLI